MIRIGSDMVKMSDWFIQNFTILVYLNEYENMGGGSRNSVIWTLFRMWWLWNKLQYFLFTFLYYTDTTIERPTVTSHSMNLSFWEWPVLHTALHRKNLKTFFEIGQSFCLSSRVTVLSKKYGIWPKQKNGHINFFPYTGFFVIIKKSS